VTDPVDLINHPPHYTSHPSGIECIQITEHMNFCVGNAIKYLWRAGLKGDDAIEDLEKAVFYVQREIERRMQWTSSDPVDLRARDAEWGLVEGEEEVYRGRAGNCVETQQDEAGGLDELVA